MLPHRIIMSIYIYLFVLFVCFVAGVYYYKDLTTSLKHLFWLVAITVVVETIGTYHLKALNQVAEWVFHLYQPFEYYLIATYFLGIIVSPKIRKVIIISIPVVVAANIFNFLFVQGPNQLGTYTFLLAAFLFCVWSGAYFFELFQKVDDLNQNLSHNPHFWICTGIIFFYAGTFFQMGFTNIISKNHQEIAQKLYIINHLLNCILYGMITYGFICQSKYQKL